MTTLMLARPDCARAVLYGGPEPEEEAARTRLVRSRMAATVAQLTSFLVVAAAASDEEDPGSVLNGFMKQTAAQLVDWVSVLAGPAVAMRGILRLRGHGRVLDERVAVPLGVALNRKGSTLTSAEARVAMQGRASKRWGWGWRAAQRRGATRPRGGSKRQANRALFSSKSCRLLQPQGWQPRR